MHPFQDMSGLQKALSELMPNVLDSFQWYLEPDTQSLEPSHCEYIISFLNNQRQSLKLISLEIITPYKKIDVSHFLKGLGAFPCLDRLKLSARWNGWATSEPGAFIQFLSLNKASLRHLVIDNCVDLSPSQCAYALACTRSCTIYPPFNSGLPLSQLEMICKAYSELLDRSQLDTLSIRVADLVPSLFVTLARYFPGLTTLNLEYSMVFGEMSEKDRVSVVVFIWR